MENGKSIDNFRQIRMNMTQEKLGQIIRTQEQIIPTKTFLHMKRKHQETITYRLCKTHPKDTLY